MLNIDRMASWEKKFWIAFPIGLLIWFNIIYPFAKDILAANFLISFLAFVIIYTFFIGWILDFDSIGQYLAFFMVFFAVDLIAFPYIVSPVGLVTTSPYATFSSDVFIWQIIGIGGIIGYNITFVLIPTLMLFIARQLVSRKML